MKQRMCLCLALLMICLTGGVFAGAEESVPVAFSIDTVSYQSVGDTVTVDFSLNTRNSNIGSMGIQIAYDSAYLQPIASAGGEYFTPGNALTACEGTLVGNVATGKVSLVSESGITQRGVLFSVDFQVLAEIEDIASVTATFFSLPANAETLQRNYEVTVTSGGIYPAEDIPLDPPSLWEPVEAEVTATDEYAPTQMITVSVPNFYGEVSGMYWGTDLVAENNPFSQQLQVEITSPGTYYITVVGLASDDPTALVQTLATGEITLYGLTFDPQNGTTPTDVLAVAKADVTPPTPHKEGYTFMGWSAEKEAVTGTLTVTATHNALYYGLWQQNSIPGDVNSDGTVDAKDALAALKHAVGKPILSPELVTLGDLNGDGILDAKDALAMLKIAVAK